MNSLTFESQLPFVRALSYQPISQAKTLFTLIQTHLNLNDYEDLQLAVNTIEAELKDKSTYSD